MNKDAGAAELKQKIAALERQLAEKTSFASRQPAVSDEQDAIVASTLARGLAKENEKLATEVASLKHTLAEWKAKQAGSSKGNLDHASFEVQELKEVVQRLQDDLMKKDEFYRKREDANKAKLMMYDSLEAACKQKDKDVSSLKDEKSDLNSKLQASSLRINTLETKIKNLTNENTEINDKLYKLKNENQE